VLDSKTPDIATLEIELAVRARQQAAVAYLGQRALSGIALQALMDETVELTALTLGAEYSHIFQMLPEGDRLLLVAGVGWKEGTVGMATVSAGLDTQAGYTLAATEPVLVEDLSLETRFSEPASLAEPGLVSGMSVTIQGRPQPYGVLGVYTAQRRIYSRDDVNFLLSVANTLAAAIDRKQVEDSLIALNATLEKRIEQGTGYVHMLKDVAVYANEAASIEEALQFVIRRVCRYTGWPIGHVYWPSSGFSKNEFTLEKPEQA
jgi:signal transduction protein with GAF and PtsI domain